MGCCVCAIVFQSCNQAVKKWDRVIISISRQVIGTILAEYNNTQALWVQQRVGAHFTLRLSGHGQ